MLGDLTGQLVIGLIVFAAPLFVGISLLRQEGNNRFTLFTALLTLKPVLATPIWFVLLFPTSHAPYWIYAALPGFVITLLLLVIFRDVVFDLTCRRSLLRLLGLDFVRWGSSNLFMLFMGLGMSITGTLILFCGMVLLALAMPTIFALYVAFKLE